MKISTFFLECVCNVVCVCVYAGEVGRGGGLYDDDETTEEEEEEEEEEGVGKSATGLIEVSHHLSLCMCTSVYLSVLCPYEVEAHTLHSS